MGIKFALIILDAIFINFVFSGRMQYQALVDTINRDVKGTWKAALASGFDYNDPFSMKHKVGTIPVVELTPFSNLKPPSVISSKSSKFTTQTITLGAITSNIATNITNVTIVNTTNPVINVNVVNTTFDVWYTTVNITKGNLFTTNTTNVTQAVLMNINNQTILSNRIINTVTVVSFANTAMNITNSLSPNQIMTETTTFPNSTSSNNTKIYNYNFGKGSNCYNQASNNTKVIYIVRNVTAPSPSPSPSPIPTPPTNPTGLDLRLKYPNCNSIKLIRNQGACGSCYAFSAANTASDMHCIQLSQHKSFSQTYIISCTNAAAYLDGCEGGYIHRVFENIVTNGLITGELYGDTAHCQPYFLHPSALTSKSPPCRPTSCVSASVAFQPTKGKNYYAVTGATAMIDHLNKKGSLACAMKVYQDFTTYRSGVYSFKSGGYQGGHAIKIIGYGNDPVAGDFWLAANSWGTSWGESGFFRIKRGSNECLIEYYSCYSINFV